MPFITKINVSCHSVFEVCASLIKLLMVRILSTVYSSLNCICSTSINRKMESVRSRVALCLINHPSSDKITWCAYLGAYSHGEQIHFQVIIFTALI